MKKLLSLISIVFYTMCINAQSFTYSFDSTMFIPDGPSCPPGILYANVFVNNFPINAVISTDSDIVSICINIEHSYVGDLGFKLFCPNGQNVRLDANNYTGNNYLGVPYKPDGSPACDSLVNPHGTGWNYCWSSVYPNNGLTLNQLSASTGTGTIMVGDKRTIDSTNVYIHTNYIKSDSSFASLIGCPLNGI